MAGHKALGRGLDALFGASPAGAKKDAAEGGDAREIAVEKIKPNRHQPRVEFDDAALADLAQSIKRHGVAQPLVVTETAVAGEFELVAGERRLRASKLAGLKTVPCVIRKYSNQQRFEIALVENIQRENLNALEEAVALEGLMREYNLTQEQVAEAIGKSRSAVANMLRILRLHEDVQAALRANRISEGHAKVLAGVPEHSEQLRLLGRILSDSLSVRDLEALLAGTKPARKVSAKAAAAPRVPEAKKYEEDFQRRLGRRVEIQSNGKKGWIRFAFYSAADLDALCARLGLLEDTGDDTVL